MQKVFNLLVWEESYVRAYEDTMRVYDTPQFQRVCGLLKSFQVLLVGTSL